MYRIYEGWHSRLPLQHVEDNIYYNPRTGIFYWVSWTHIDNMKKRAERYGRNYFPALEDAEQLFEL